MNFQPPDPVCKFCDDNCSGTCEGAREAMTIGISELCSDCPPVGYPTERTRCTECPRRAGELELDPMLEEHRPKTSDFLP